MPAGAAAGASTPEVVLIAAVARDGAIGRGNALPWRLPADQKRFAALTRGHTVIMGRLTWDSLPPRFRPLPQRRNLVITRQPGWHAEGAEVVAGWPEALAATRGEPKVFVIGGGQVYAEALPDAAVLELTEVQAEVPDADVRFPDWDRQAFTLVARESHPASDAAPAFDFVTWRRRR